MQITYRIPSKKVPYGYVEIVDSNAAMPQPDELAEWYADYIRKYQAAEVAAFEAAPAKPKPLPTAIPDEADDEVVDAATKMLNEGLGGAEEIDENAPAKPWDRTSDETEATTEKPWDLDDSEWDM